MKLTLLLACAGLGLVGCTTEHYRGGVNSPYETEYGTGYSYRTPAPYMHTYNSIYPVRKQPSPNGNDAGGVKPLMDPSREYGWERETYYRDYPPKAPVPPPPSEIIP
jgi:hypothetical protein